PRYGAHFLRPRISSSAPFTFHPQWPATECICSLLLLFCVLSYSLYPYVGNGRFFLMRSTKSKVSTFWSVDAIVQSTCPAAQSKTYIRRRCTAQWRCQVRVVCEGATQ